MTTIDSAGEKKPASYRVLCCCEHARMEESRP